MFLTLFVNTKVYLPALIEGNRKKWREIMAAKARGLTPFMVGRYLNI